jgi:hypothetical protein
MAQRKKRATVRKGRSTARRKARKPSKSARGRQAKRTVARATPKKHLAKAKVKRGAKKVARKKVRAVKPPSTPAVETVVVDVVEEPLLGVTVVTEFEATEVREASAAPEEPEEGQGPAPPEFRGTIESDSCGADGRRLYFLRRSSHVQSRY